MKQLRLLMGMPITIEIADPKVTPIDIDKIFTYFMAIDNQFSPYKKTSEVSRFNQGKIFRSQLSPALKFILRAAEKTRMATHGYFNICQPNGLIDPSGIVKGWAIYNASKLIDKMGFKNYYINGGGDIQTKGKQSKNRPWNIGIRNPFNRYQNIKIISVGNHGIATSGTSIRGQHIYDPFHPQTPINEIISLTVIGPNIYEADRLATAAFAMRKKGVEFIATLPNFAAYSINQYGLATFTPNFNQYVVKTN